MIRIIKEQEQYKGENEWLTTYHHFSFAEYYDPSKVNFGPLRVFNDDVIQPGTGFDFHQHQDMEIVTYVLEGALEHKDGLGNGSVIRPGEVQRMSAGRGITHSEFNPSKTDAVHFLQIWILPEELGIVPSYEQQAIDLSVARGTFHPIASGHGGPGKVKLNQDAAISVALLEPGQKLVHHLAHSRHAWLQLARGAITVNGGALGAGDGGAVSSESELKIEADCKAEILLFDLA